MDDNINIQYDIKYTMEFCLSVLNLVHNKVCRTLGCNTD